MQISDELRVIVDAEVERAIERLRAFDDSLGDAERGANDLGAALEEQFREALSARNAIAQLGAALSSGIAIYALASKGVEAFTGFVKSSVEAFGEYETIQSNLAVVLGSTEQASAAFENLKEMAARTPFSVSGLTEAAIQLKQTGTGMRDMTRTLAMLGDAAGGSDEKFRRLVANYAQIQSVGKTTAQDIKQFAQMGLPIYDTLREMGVQGEATGNQIAEAFRLMTSEGGAFYGGMAAGAETLAGKTSTLKDAWREYKATFAETTGLGQAWKQMLDQITADMQAQTDEMNRQKAVREAMAAAANSDTTDKQELALLDDQIKKLKEKWALAQQIPNPNALTLRLYNDQIQALEKMKEPYQAAVDLAAERAAEEERLAGIVEDSAAKYDTALAEINAKYAETQAGKIAAIEAEIQKYREYLAIRKQVTAEDPADGTPVSVGLDDEARGKAAAVIAMLSESLEKMNKSLEKSKTEMEDWKKVLKDAMGFSDRDIAGGVLDTGVKAVEEYEQRIKASAERIRKVNGLSADQPDLPKDAADKAERIRAVNGLLGDQSDLLQDTASKWEKLLSAMVESGKWDGTEESFKKVVENLTLAKEALKDDDYTKKIGELQKKINDLGKSEGELAKEMMEANKYTPQQAEEVKKLIDEHDRKEILAAFQAKLEGLEKDQYALARATLEARNATEGELEVFDDMVKKIKAMEEAQEAAKDAAKGWEEVFAEWTAGRLRGVFSELSEEAAAAVGSINANLASISFDGMLQGLSAVGEAFARGEDAGAAFRNAMSQMAQQMLEALPSLFLQAGLQLIVQGQWPLGLGFIAAAGSAALFAGIAKGTIAEESENAERNARGNVFDQALVRAYARGGAFTNQVVDRPTYFRHGGGLGLMGEAGPEAVIPLKRMPNGDLGVTAESGGGTNVVVNIINNSGAEVSRREQTDQRGNKQIDVIIGQMIDSHLSSGKADRALSSRYDVKVKGV